MPHPTLSFHLPDTTSGLLDYVLIPGTAFTFSDALFHRSFIFTLPLFDHHPPSSYSSSSALQFMDAFPLKLQLSSSENEDDCLCQW
ncbi:unnamed protein product [Schistocephalus solidus]|uniref:Ovule protein n=1 Tax=Schistocephalus solidus TaxID=70667 RepID=A0A183SWN6_SCHSO|nr:unnamed protein product [Schistocephalus solidus]